MIAVYVLRASLLVDSMAKTINAIVVAGANDHLELVNEVWGINVPDHPDDLLEFARGHVRERHGIETHALRWADSSSFHLGGPTLILFSRNSGRYHAGPKRSKSLLARNELVLTSSREPWTHCDWLDNTEAWIRNSFRGVTRLSQIRVGTTGTVLKIETVSGTFFLKSVPQALSREVKLLELLNKHAPGICARLYPLRPNASTHITYAVPGRQLFLIDEQEPWERAIETIANLQIRSVEMIEEFQQIGLPWRRLEAFESGNLATSIDAMLAGMGKVDELSEQELREVRGLAEKAAGDCAVLRRCHLPETIMNNDLNQSNVFSTSGGTTTLIDWTFSRISHPFFVLSGTLLGEEYISLPLHVSTGRLTERYLACWSRFCSPELLRSGLAAASRLIRVDYALYLAELKPVFKDIDAGTISRSLRRALRAYDLSLSSV